MFKDYDDVLLHLNEPLDCMYVRAYYCFVMIYIYFGSNFSMFQNKFFNVIQFEINIILNPISIIEKIERWIIDQTVWNNRKDILVSNWL